MFNPSISLPRELYARLGIDLPPGPAPLSEILAAARSRGLAPLALLAACVAYCHERGMPTVAYDRIVAAGASVPQSR